MITQSVLKALSELKLNTSLTTLNLSCKQQSIASLILMNADCNIRTEGAINLLEALKSNTSLKTLDLTSNIHMLHFILTLCR
jgi:hypothetical protein